MRLVSVHRYVIKVSTPLVIQRRTQSEDCLTRIRQIETELDDVAALLGRN